MCKNNNELDSISKENLEEIYNTIQEIEKGNFQIVKQEHLINNMTFQNGLVPIGEKYIIEVLYTCQICEKRKNDKGVCSLNNQLRDQICTNFKRGDIFGET